MSQIDLIRAKIERLKGQLIRGACAAQIQMETSCKDEAYDEMLSFLSDLEKEEKPSEGLEEEITKWFAELDKKYGVTIDFGCADIESTARHFAQWGAEHLKK